MTTSFSRREAIRLSFSLPLGLSTLPALAEAARSQERSIAESLVPVYLPSWLKRKLIEATNHFSKEQNYAHRTREMLGAEAAKRTYNARQTLCQAYWKREQKSGAWYPVILDAAQQLSDAIAIMRDLPIRPAAEVRKEFLAALKTDKAMGQVDLADAFTQRSHTVQLKNVRMTKVLPGKPLIESSGPGYRMIIEPGDPIIHEYRKDVRVRMGGYRGARWSDDELTALSRLSGLLQMEHHPEYRYRRLVLLAESYVYERRFADAARQYREIDALEERWRKSQSAPHPLHALAVCRFANGLILWGDHLFRQARSLDDVSRDAARAKYLHALQRLDRLTIPSDSLLHVYAATRAQAARLQLQRLDSGLNAYGVADGLPPVHSVVELAKNALVSLEQAEAAAQQHRFHAARIAAIKEQGNELQLKRQLSDLRRRQSDLAVRSAKDKLRIIDIHLQAAEHQREMSRQKAWYAFSLGAMAGVMKLANKDPSGIFNLHPGSVLLDQAAQSGQYRFLVQRLKREQVVAGRTAEIARLEAQAADLEAAHLARLLAKHQSASLACEYELAEYFYELATRSARLANRDLYEYERALAARYLKPELEVVRLDYQATSIKANGKHADFGISEMRDDFQRLRKETSFHADHGHRRTVVLDLNFRRHFPEELKALIETGETTFQPSLYGVERRIAGAYGLRIEAFCVTLFDAQASPEPLVVTQHPYGELTHTGLFVERDRLATLAAPSSPPVEDTEPPSYTSVGVLRRALSAEVVHLSRDTEILMSTGRRDGAEPSQTPLLSNHSPAGLWRLQINKREHRRVGNVVIQLRVAYFLDTRLRERVVRLQEAFAREINAFLQRSQGSGQLGSMSD